MATIREYKYFISGKIKCSKNKSDGYKCVFNPYIVDTKKYEEKYRSMQNKKTLLTKNARVISLGKADDVIISEDKISALYLGERKRVCIIEKDGEEEILTCGLSVEDKENSMIMLRK